MKVFSVSFGGGSSRSGSSSASSSSSSSSSTKRPSSGPVKDDRPFPSPSKYEESSSAGTYIISSPPRYEHIRVPAHYQGFRIYEDGSSGSGARKAGGGSRFGCHSNPESPKLSLRNPFQRSRSSSSSGRHKAKALPRAGSGEFVWPTAILPAKQQQQHSNNHNKPASPSTEEDDEPIYSEPLPPVTHQIREAGRTALKYFPDPASPVQISSHIYEYLVSRRSDASTATGRPAAQPPPPPMRQRPRRGSLASSTATASPSSGSPASSLANAKTGESPESSSGRKPKRLGVNSKTMVKHRTLRSSMNVEQRS